MIPKNRLGFFLKPDEPLFSNIVNIKKDFRKLKLESHFLDDEPHLTLMHGYFSNKESVIDKFEQLKINEKIELTAKGPLIFYDDIFKGFHTLALEIQLNAGIKNIQKLFLEEFLPDKESVFDNLEENYLKNVKKFKYPFVGEDLIPHISIGNIKIERHNLYLKNFLKCNFEDTQYFASIYIGEIINNKLFEIQEKNFEI